MDEPKSFLKCNIGKFSQEKLATLVENFEKLSFGIKVVNDESYFYEFFWPWDHQIIALYEDDEQDKRFYTPSSLIDYLNKYFIQRGEVAKLHGRYQDTQLNILLEINEVSDLILSFTYQDWQKYVWEINKNRDPFIDNIRYIDLILKLLEPFVLYQFAVLPRDEQEISLGEVDLNCIAIVGPKEAAFDSLLSDLIYGALYAKWFIKIDPSQENLPPIDKIVNLLKERKVNELYFEQGGFRAKLFIDFDTEQIYLYPQAPYKIKLYDAEQSIDVSFYFKLVLGMYNNLIITELRANFERY